MTNGLSQASLNVIKELIETTSEVETLLTDTLLSACNYNRPAEGVMLSPRAHEVVLIIVAESNLERLSTSQTSKEILKGC